MTKNTEETADPAPIAGTASEKLEKTEAAVHWEKEKIRSSAKISARERTRCSLRERKNRFIEIPLPRKKQAFCIQTDTPPREQQPVTSSRAER